MQNQFCSKKAFNKLLLFSPFFLSLFLSLFFSDFSFSIYVWLFSQTTDCFFIIFLKLTFLGGDSFTYWGYYSIIFSGKKVDVTILGLSFLLIMTFLKGFR